MRIDKCYRCGVDVDPATCDIIWTYATSADESYCAECGDIVRYG